MLDYMNNGNQLSGRTKLPELKKSQLQALCSRPVADSPKMISGFKFPPGGHRLTTVSLPPSRRTHRVPQSISESLLVSTKVIRWDEANESRPPLPVDLEGPGPLDYYQDSKPLRETNAPAYSFGRKSWPEKSSGGSRSSWQKPWFNTTNVWCDKVNFHAENTWPGPSSYRLASFVEKNAVNPQPPSFTIGKKYPFSIVRQCAEKEPSPNNYSLDSSLALTHRNPAAFSHQFRRGGTQLWDSVEATPGPGSYNINYGLAERNRPSYSMSQARRKTSHELGPFAAF